MGVTVRPDQTVSCFFPLAKETGNEWKRKLKRIETAPPEALFYRRFQETILETRPVNSGNQGSATVSPLDERPSSQKKLF